MAASRFPGGQKYARVRRAFGGPQLVESGEVSPVTSFNGRTGVVTLTQDDTLDALSLDFTGNALNMVRVNAAETAFELVPVVGVTDGDKGDIVVSASGTTWNFDSSVVSAFARTILDDADAATVRTTIGAAATAHTHIIADVTNLQASLDAKLDDTQATAFGLSLLDDADAAAARTTLALGTAATQNIGTSGAVIPLLNGGNAWSGVNTYSAASLFRGSLAGLVGASAAVVGYVNVAGFGAIFYGRDPSTGNNTNVRIAGSGLTFAIGASGDGTTRMTISAAGIDVTGQVQCDTLRVDAVATAAAVAQTHHIPISINGVTYKLLLAA